MSTESRHNAAKKAWETRRANGWTSPKGKRAESRARARQGYGAPWSDSRPYGGEARPNAEPPRNAEPESSAKSGPFDTGVQGRGSFFDAYRILGVDSGTCAEAIQRAFKKLMIQNHPDRGSDDEDRKRRTAKCAGISWAFHKLCPPN